MYLTVKNTIINFILFIVYIIFSIITFIVVRNTLHVFLVWNMLLAFVPYAIVFLIDQKIVKSKLGIAISLLIWLFFFPNSLYIITDLIYVDSSNFVVIDYLSMTYLQDIPSYLALMHIFLGAFLGLMYGFKSLSVLYEYSKDSIIKKYRYIIVIFIFFLSSFAIYIGRFYRYNSWDILRLFSILKDFILNFNGFILFFIFSYTILLSLLFFILKVNFKHKK